MRFEELAAEAGNRAAAFGNLARRPDFGQVLTDRRRRAMVSRWTAAVVLAATVVGIMLAMPEQGQQLGPLAEPATPDRPTAPAALEGVPESCPVTVPGDDAFQPAAKAPPGPDPAYEAVWYGRPALWSMVSKAGEVWRDLPVGSDGTLTQMLSFWSENHTPGDGSEVLLFGESLDGSPYGIRARGGGGSDPDLGNHLAVVFDIPEPGCWRIIAIYKARSIEFVAWVEGD